MQTHLDPNQMTSEECRAEVASILARGFLRLQKNKPEQTDKSPDSSQKQLDVLGDQSVHGHAG